MGCGGRFIILRLADYQALYPVLREGCARADVGGIVVLKRVFGAAYSRWLGTKVPRCDIFKELARLRFVTAIVGAFTKMSPYQEREGDLCRRTRSSQHTFPYHSLLPKGNMESKRC
jgi:hypothetical protein